MKVQIQNLEAVWCEYRFEVEIPDDTPEDQINDVALEELFENDGVIVWGGETLESVGGIDQEYNVLGVVE